jgi:hypothetical protein
MDFRSGDGGDVSRLGKVEVKIGMPGDVKMKAKRGDPGTVEPLENPTDKKP